MLRLTMILLLVISNYSFAIVLPEYSVKYDNNRNALKDFKAAIRDANEQNKLVLIELGFETCPSCIKLDRFFEVNSDIEKALYDTFMVVKVDIIDNHKNKSFFDLMPLMAKFIAPYYYIADRSGKLIGAQLVGALGKRKHGGYSGGKFMRFLRHWSAANASLNIETPKNN